MCQRKSKRDPFLFIGCSSQTISSLIHFIAAGMNTNLCAKNCANRERECMRMLNNHMMSSTLTSTVEGECFRVRAVCNYRITRSSLAHQDAVCPQFVGHYDKFNKGISSRPTSTQPPNLLLDMFERATSPVPIPIPSHRSPFDPNLSHLDGDAIKNASCPASSSQRSCQWVSRFALFCLVRFAGG